MHSPWWTETWDWLWIYSLFRPRFAWLEASLSFVFCSVFLFSVSLLFLMCLCIPQACRPGSIPFPHLPMVKLHKTIIPLRPLTIMEVGNDPSKETWLRGPISLPWWCEEAYILIIAVCCSSTLSLCHLWRWCFFLYFPALSYVTWFFGVWKKPNCSWTTLPFRTIVCFRQDGIHAILKRSPMGVPSSEQPNAFVDALRDAYPSYPAYVASRWIMLHLTNSECWL